MARQIRLLVLIIAAIALANVAGPVVAQSATRVVITVSSDSNSLPVHGARLYLYASGGGFGARAMGKGIRRIEEPTFRQIEDLTQRGLKLPGGRIVLQLLPGRYAVQALYPEHRSDQQIVEVVAGGPAEQEVAIKMTHVAERSARRIIVTVRGAVSNRPGAATDVPLSGAAVVINTETGLQGGKRTDAAGEVTWNVPEAVIGDTVRIRISAVGYVPEERTVVFGSMQENIVQSSATNITATDRVAVNLKRPPKTEQTVSIIVLVEDTDGRPIPNAAVGTEYVEGPGRVVATSNTGEDGKTRPPALHDKYISANSTGFFRLRAGAVGYRRAMSEIPAEYLRPGPPRLYLVRLDRSTDVSAGNFTGQWSTMVGRIGYYRDVSLTQSGKQVTGNYTHRSWSGTMEGTVTGNILKFKWTENGKSNTGELALTSDRKGFTGWYNDDNLYHNPWGGKRK